MADIITEVTPETGAGAGTPAPAPSKEQMIPKHRFDEVYGQMKSLQEELTEIKKSQETQKTKELEDTQQFKTLYEKQKAEYEALHSQSTAYQTSVSQYETVINGLVESKLASVPAELHDLIPANLTVTEKLDWITKAESKGLFGAKQTVNVPIGQPMGVPTLAEADITKLSPQELLLRAYSTKK